MSEKIVILDSGIANLGSVYNALKKIKIPAEVTRSTKVLMEAPGLIFPGVGSFGYASLEIRRRGWDVIIKDYLSSGKPFLGICLGMQLLLDDSEEDGGNRGDRPKGLGAIPGSVVRFGPGLPVPHVGWNQVYTRESHPLFKGIAQGSFFYFTHSYYVMPEFFEQVLATTDYGVSFSSAVCCKNVVGVQFHPEKSGPVGLRFLSNFGSMVFNSA